MTEFTIEQQRALALAAARRRRAEAEASAAVQDGPSGATRLVQGINTGLATVAGAPVDLANAFLRLGEGAVSNMTGTDLRGTLSSDEPFAGSASIQRALSGIGAAPSPDAPVRDDLASRIGQYVGEGLGTVATMGAAGLANIARAGMQTVRGAFGPARVSQTGAIAAPPTQAIAVQTGRPSSVASGIMQDTGRDLVERPLTTLAAETAAATGAAAAGFAAERVAPDSLAARFISEVLGGFAPAAAGMAARRAVAEVGNLPAVSFVRALLSRSSAPGSLGAGRAQQRVLEVAHDPASALRNMDDAYLPSANLTAAQTTRDPGVISLAESVIRTSGRAQGQSAEQIANAVAAYRAAAAEVGGGVPVDAARDAVAQTRDEMAQLIEQRIQAAAQAADARIGALGEGVTAREAEEIARHELELAYQAARQMEDELYAAVPTDVTVDISPVRSALEDMIRTAAVADREDVPAYVAGLLDEMRLRGQPADAPIDPSSLPDTTTVREMQRLRSRLLRDARNAAAGSGTSPPNRERAAMLSQLADAALTAMNARHGAASGDAGVALRIALDFSRNLNDRFTEGTVGDLLGLTRAGRARVASPETLSASIAGGGAHGDVAQADLLRAMEMRSPDNPLRMPPTPPGTPLGDPEAMRQAISDFLRQEFYRRTTTQGQFNVSAANTFMSRFARQLEQVPELRQQLQQAIDTQNIAAAVRTEGQAEMRALMDPRQTVASAFLNANPRQEMARIAATRNPGAAMAELVQMVQRDASGRALAGLKTAFVEHWLDRAATNATTNRGDVIADGVALNNLLQPNTPEGQMALRLMSPTEIENMRIIARTAEAIHMAANARPAEGGVIRDAAGVVRSALAGVLGAHVGREIAPGTIQGPGIIANVFRRAAAWGVNDPARRLITDAVQDQTRNLLRALLERPDTPEAREFINSQLNAWLAVIAHEYGAAMAAQAAANQGGGGLTVDITRGTLVGDDEGGNDRN